MSTPVATHMSSSANTSPVQAPSASSASQSSPANVPTSPITSSTPTPTPQSSPQSSPAQTSSAAARTTSANSASSSSSSALAPATSTSAFTSQVATTFSTTDPSGSIVIVTSTVPDVITTTAVISGTGHSNSNTGIIVGSVVGGVAGITILVLLLLCIRRRVRKDEFDGNFDPDRVVGHADVAGGTLPNIDLADDVTPFPQSYAEQGSMREYGKSPYIPVPSSLGPSGHASSEFYSPGSTGGSTSVINAQHRTFVQPGAGPPPPGVHVPPINMYGTGPVDWHSPRPGVSPPPSTAGNTTSTRISKEREAMGRGGQGVGLGLATQAEAGEGSGDVVVHQDAGRAPIDVPAPPREIPPSYDSIRQD